MGIIDSNINPSQFVEAREQRQVARDNRIHQATDLISAQRLDAGTIASHQETYNQIIADVDRLREPGGFFGGGLTAAAALLQVDRKVDEATQPAHDNGKAADIKREYRDACREMNRETSQAWRTAMKLGPGTHRLSNGDTVTVTTDPQTLETTVETVGADGSTKKVTTGNGRAVVEKTWPDGLSSVTTQHGTDISKREKSPFGETTFDYHLDDSGRVVRDRRGPAADDDEHTVVNHDGSTDTRTYVYTDDSGRKACEEKHENPAGGFPPFPGPHPWPENEGGGMPFPPIPLPYPRPGNEGGGTPFPLPHPWPEDEGGPTPFPPLGLPIPPPFQGGPAPHPWPENEGGQPGFPPLTLPPLGGGHPAPHPWPEHDQDPSGYLPRDPLGRDGLPPDVET